MEAYWGKLTLCSVILAGSVMTGGMIPLYFKKTRQHLHFLLSFSAGLMLGAAFLHLMPESFELMGKSAATWALAGFLFLYVFERFVTVHICEAMDCEVHTVGIAAIVGLSAHALGDGVALGSGLLSTELGLVIFITIFFHKLPEAFALSSILLHAEHGRSRILLFNLVLILMVPVGGALVHWVVGPANSLPIGKALAFSAGTFFHISVSDLLPEVHKHPDKRYGIFASFIVGLVMMWVLRTVAHV